MQKCISSRHVTIYQEAKSTKSKNVENVPYKEDEQHSSDHSVLPDIKASHQYHSATNDSLHILHIQLSLSFSKTLLSFLMNMLHESETWPVTKENEVAFQRGDKNGQMDEWC